VCVARLQPRSPRPYTAADNWAGESVDAITICYMLIQLEAGGAERQLVALLEGLDRTRFRPIVVVERLGGALEPSVRKLGIPIHVVARRWRRDPLFSFRLARVLRRERVDVVHPLESMLDIYGVLAGVLARVPVRLMTWRTRRYRWWHTALLWLTLPLADRLVANSEHAARWIRRWFRPASRVMAIPNGLDCERFARPPALDDKRRELGLADDAGPLIGMVARLRPDKDFESLFDAARRLRGRFPGLTVLVVGGGPRLGELEAAASRLLPLGGCRLLGQRHDVHELYHLFDVSVLATEYEGMPNVVMEAMAAGRPVVATDVEGCRELIDDGVTGLLVARRDAHALAEAIGRLLDDKALAARLGRAGREHMRAQYSLKRLVERHETLYAALLAAKRKARAQ
jgi:glycosyltransferase involved in cell wall biosynthesis